MALSSFAIHCSIGLAIRLALIIYANYHDRAFVVPYTDIDYRVCTDAARLIANGSSPYERHTYRYTPILAAILTPNILVHPDFGKIIFSLIDVIATILIKIILSGDTSCGRDKAKIFALTWLYNPLTIVVTTRGNADSIAALLVLSTIYCSDRDKPTLAGLLHGLAIHFRLYPIAFSLSLYLSLRGKKKFLLPCVEQTRLVFGCIVSLFLTNAISYYCYGYEYLYESTIYHFVRKDPRHNFSVFFYATYLSIGQTVSLAKHLAALLPQLLLLVALSFRYSGRKQLSFAIFTQAIVTVTYNRVMTSQYFFWYLSLLPLCLPRIRMSRSRWLVLVIIWLAAQGFWLYDAYLLEFKSLNTFYRIWLDGILFFVVNLKILHDIMVHYDGALRIESFID